MADQDAILEAVRRGLIQPADAKRLLGGGEGAPRPSSDLVTAPGTTEDDAARIPPGMVYDPETGGYVDTALMAERMGDYYGALSSAARGIPFAGEWIDEAAGRLDAAITGRSPEIQTQLQREAAERYERERPISAPLLQLGTGVAATAPLTMLKPVQGAFNAISRMSPLGRVGTALAGGSVTGAVEGAVQGAGAANDGDRRTGAELGGLIGGVTGGVLGAAVPVVAGGVQRGVRALSDRVGSQPSVLPGMTRAASDRILSAAEADDVAARGLSRVRDAGTGAMVADIGTATEDLLDTAVNTSPAGARAAEAVTARAAASKDILTTAFDDAMGGPEGMNALQRTIRQSTQPGVSAAYQAAYSKPIDYASDAGRAIEGILSRIPQRYRSKAAALANDLMEWDQLPRQYIISISEDGATVFEKPTIVQLDYLKRALDQIAQDGKNELTGALTSEGRLASNMARTLRNALKDAVPEYGQALDLASDAFSLQRGREMGGNLLRTNTTREVVADWAKDASEAEKRAALMGLRSAIDEQMANVTRGVTTGDIDIQSARKILRSMSSPAVRTKLAAILGDAEADKLIKTMDQTWKSQEMLAAIGANSATARRLTADRALREAADFEPGQIARDAVSGSPLNAGQRLLQKGVRNTPLDKERRVQDIYSEISDFLTNSSNPNASVQQIIDAMRRRQSLDLVVNPRVNAGVSGLGLLGYLAATQGTGMRGSSGPQ